VTSQTPRQIAVVGAGAWGTALGQTLRLAGHSVQLWTHGASTADEINRAHVNSVFLPGIPLDPDLRATNALADISGSDLILMVTPAQHLRAVASAMTDVVSPATPVVICSKGIEQPSGKLMSAVLAEALPKAIPAVLSGPSFADDVARGLPCAITVACEDANLGAHLANTIGHKLFRAYWTNDVVGVQLGGTVKTVLTIAAGIVQGRGMGASAHAALVTRGFSELVRFGIAHGARAETLMGLSGLGDLVLTCGSAQSRNMALGIALGQGQLLAVAQAGKRSVVEGIPNAAAITAIAQAKGIEMPVCQAVHAVVSRAITVDEAIDMLLSRPFKAEF
jgi:glycerol-3-phosphate dehydrogenase (NAD(P)+)